MNGFDYREYLSSEDLTKEFERCFSSENKTEIKENLYKIKNKIIFNKRVFELLYCEIIKKAKDFHIESEEIFNDLYCRFEQVLSWWVNWLLKRNKKKYWYFFTSYIRNHKTYIILRTIKKYKSFSDSDKKNIELQYNEPEENEKEKEYEINNKLKAINEIKHTIKAIRIQGIKCCDIQKLFAIDYQGKPGIENIKKIYNEHQIHIIRETIRINIKVIKNKYEKDIHIRNQY